MNTHQHPWRIRFAILSFLLALLFPALSQGQVSTYAFSAGAGTYTPLSGGTILTISDPDDGYVNSLPIGFNFVYDGTACTTFAACTNGFIKFGTIGGSDDTWTNGLSSTNINRPLVAALWDDNFIDATGTSAGDIQYQVSGSGTSHVLTVQWRNMRWGGGSGSTNPTNNVQVQLYEGTNAIKIIYGTMNGANAGSSSASIGLNGGSSFLSVTPAASPSASAATSNNGINAATYLTSGTTYTFTPPVPAPLTIGTIAAVQQTGNVTAASANNNVLRIDVPATGNTGTQQLTSVTFNYTGTSAADIAAGGVKLWTGTASAPATQIGTAQSISGGTVTFSGLSASITAGTTYLWLTMSTAAGAALGNNIDASVPAGGMQFTAAAGAAAAGTQPPALLDPAGNRPVGYCTPASTCTNEYIKTVSLNGYTSPTTACGTGYADYTGSGSVTTLNQAGTYSLSVLAHINDNNSQAGVWIDYNQNGIFETTEFTLLGTQSGTNTDKTYTSNITVPAGALAGTTRMRVRSSNGQGVANSSACATSNTFGEYEDYMITIAASVACSGTPPVAAASATVATICPNTSFTLNAANLPAAGITGISYQWQSSPAGAGTFTNISGATTASYTITNQAAATDYQLIVSCNAGPSSSTSNIVAVAQSGTLSCYCTPTNGNCGFEWVKTVTVNTLSNNNGTCTTGGYADYTTNPALTTTLSQGGSYPISVLARLNAPNAQAAVWIDYNQNGIFETSEFTLLGTGPATGYASLDYTYNTTLNIPLTALTGQTRMRVRGSNNTLPNTGACPTAAYYGEVEDYLITIGAQSPCSGVPAAATASSSPAAACASTPFTLSATGYIAGQTGYTFQWQSSPAGQNVWTAITGATTPSYTVPGQSSTTDYRLQITCANSGQSSISNATTVTTNFLNCYCTPSYSSNCSGDNIASASLGTLSIAGLSCSPNIVDKSPLQPGTLPIPDLAQGSTVNLTISFGSDGNQYHRVWVDFNQNGVLESTESFSTGANAGSNGTVTVAITVPANAVTGITRLRIRGGDDNQPTAAQACGAAVSSYGSALDFNVNIIAPPCTGAPVAGTASAGTGFCSSTSATLSLSGYTTGNSGISIQWQSSATPGGPYTNVSGATASSYTTPLLSSATYYVAVVTCAGSGLQAMSNEVALGVSPAALADAIGASNTITYTQPGTAMVTNTDCEMMAQVAQSGAAPVTGTVSMKVFLDGSVQLFNNMPLLTRHYEITPAANAASATATITLYATQAEFDAYNTYVTANSLNLPLMPVNGTDNGNVHIHKEAGTSATGVAGTYTPGTQTDIVPAVSWNAAKSWWEMTFPVTGFSGFFITTGSGNPLPVVITAISARNEGAGNRIDWHTGVEQNIAAYEVQRRTGGGFMSLGQVSAAGSGRDYQFYDRQPAVGRNDYRLLVKELSGMQRYSEVVTAFAAGKDGFMLNAFPNPVTGSVSISVSGVRDGEATLTLSDVSGKIVAQKVMTGSTLTMDMTPLPRGIYLLRYRDARHSERLEISKL